MVIHLAPVVPKLDNTIHWINLYPLKNAIGFLILIHWIVIYPVGSAIQRLNNPGLVDSTIQHLNNRNLFNCSKVRDSDPSWHQSSEVTGTGEGGMAMGIK